MDRPARARGLPDHASAKALCGWLAGPRGKLLRRAQIGLRRRILEVGCGHGYVTPELARRCPGHVVAMDLDPTSVRTRSGAWALIAADVHRLPLPDASFDLVFCQNVLMWADDLQTAVGECARVLAPGGTLLAIEPDYGGMMEYPEQISLREVWTAALARLGADPHVGRKLPMVCSEVGLEVHVELQNMPQPPTPEAIDLLLEMPLRPSERLLAEQVRGVFAQDGRGWRAFCHVPYLLVQASA